MAGFDWKSLVGTIAPMLGTALGGPMGGMAAKVLSNTLLGKDDASESEISLALQNASPETLLKIKEADNAFAIEMERLGVDLVKIAAESQDSARKMQIANKALIVPVLAGLTVAGFFGTMAWVLTGHVSLESTILGFVLGQISAKTEQVYNFYFGSSAGSKEKTAHLATRTN